MALNWLFKRNSWSAVTDWWRNQRHRWMKDGRCHQNIYDVVKNEELRQRIAPMLQQLFPNIGTCNHCKWPWPLVDAHDTSIDHSRGVFVVCEFCWNHLLRYGQEDKIRQLYWESYKRNWRNVFDITVLENALNRDFGPKPEISMHAMYPEQQ